MARVLVVEPDRQIRNFIAGILADFGHYVRQCGDAGDARQWLRRARFDVLATDLALGEDAGDILPSARRVPVLTLSGRRLCTTSRSAAAICTLSWRQSGRLSRHTRSPPDLRQVPQAGPPIRSRMRERMEWCYLPRFLPNNAKGALTVYPFLLHLNAASSSTASIR